MAVGLCQRDLVIHGAAAAANAAGAQLAQYAGHRRIVFHDKCGEPADPRGAGALGQPGEQFGRQSQALPVVDDGDGDLGGPRVGGVADVPGDADAAPARVIQRAEGLVVEVIDVGEVAKLRRGQLVLPLQEPHPAGSGAQPGEDVRHQRGVTGPDLPYQHRRFHRAVPAAHPPRQILAGFQAHAPGRATAGWGATAAAIEGHRAW